MFSPPVVSLRRWTKNNRLGATHLNESPDAIDAILMSMASAQPDGTTPINAECWPGTIKAAGPNGESNYTNERYWVQRTFIAGSVPSGQVVLQPDPLGGAGDQVIPTSLGTGTPNVFTVTNIAEIKSHTHALVPGSNVWVWASFDAGLTSVPGASGETASQPDNQKHYLTCLAVDPIFQLVANATPQGTYTAHPLYPSSTLLATANSTWLTQSNMGSVDSTTTVYLANEAEYGLSGHKLLFDGATYLPQVFRASYWKQADDGKPVFRFFGMQWKAC